MRTSEATIDINYCTQTQHCNTLILNWIIIGTQATTRISHHCHIINAIPHHITLGCAEDKCFAIIQRRVRLHFPALAAWRRDLWLWGLQQCFMLIKVGCPLCMYLLKCTLPSDVHCSRHSIPVIATGLELLLSGSMTCKL